jgi:hypothetical protein
LSWQAWGEDNDGVNQTQLAMTANHITIQTADDLAYELLSKFDLIGLEGCEETETGFTYFFESGHWAEVFATNDGINYKMHQSDEE